MGMDIGESTGFQKGALTILLIIRTIRIRKHLYSAKINRKGVEDSYMKLITVN